MWADDGKPQKEADWWNKKSDGEIRKKAAGKKRELKALPFGQNDLKINAAGRQGEWYRARRVDTSFRASGDPDRSARGAVRR